MRYFMYSCALLFLIGCVTQKEIHDSKTPSGEVRRMYHYHIAVHTHFQEFHALSLSVPCAFDDIDEQMTQCYLTQDKLGRFPVTVMMWTTPTVGLPVIGKWVCVKGDYDVVKSVVRRMMQ